MPGSTTQRRMWAMIAAVAMGVLVSGACSDGAARNDAAQLAPNRDPVATAPPAFDEAVGAAEEEQLGMVRRSLEQGMDVNQADADGRTALMLAAFDGLTEVVRLLLDHGAEVDRRDVMGRTALMFAASGPFPDTVVLLLDAGAEVNAVDADEHWSALMFAAGEGQTEVVELLLERGADRSLADVDGETAEDHARMRGHEEMARLLRSWPNPPS